MNKIEQAYLNGFIKTANGFGTNLGELLGGAEKMVGKAPKATPLTEVAQPSSALELRGDKGWTSPGIPQHPIIDVESQVIPEASDPAAAGKFHFPNFMRSLREKLNKNPMSPTGAAIAGGAVGAGALGNKAI